MLGRPRFITRGCIERPFSKVRLKAFSRAPTSRKLALLFVRFTLTSFGMLDAHLPRRRVTQIAAQRCCLD